MASARNTYQGKTLPKGKSSLKAMSEDLGAKAKLKPKAPPKAISGPPTGAFAKILSRANKNIRAKLMPMAAEAGLGGRLSDHDYDRLLKPNGRIHKGAVKSLKRGGGF